jgi:dinuclear metal center YbgI/SA1388 family protein
MKIKDIAVEIEKIAPLELAQDWDNVGLLIVDGKSNVKNILLTIDVTTEVVAEAKRLRTDLIISYHPVIWDGLKQVTVEGTSSVAYDLIRSGVSVYSIHTALDSAVGGVNDGLAEIVGIVNGEPIGDYVENPGGDKYKLVVFVPVKAVAKVSNAVFAAGAGAIGNYSHCGFTSEGQGSFLPLEGAKPTIGRKGKPEKVPEIRFETVVPANRLSEVIAAMKKAHPYETLAFDCYKLYESQNKFGLGRIGKLAKPMQLDKIIARIKKQTGAKAIGTIGREKRVVRKAAVCAGSCGKIINSVISAKCDLYVTGELKHHHALAAQEADLTCVCLSHSVSERFILKKFAKQLQGKLKQVNIKTSKKDADPFRWKEL